MSQFPCLRQLRCSIYDNISSSPSRRAPVSLSHASAFSTSRILLREIKTKQISAPVAQRKGESNKFTRVTNKKAAAEAAGSRRAQPGDRKAMRKRIVLSNTNALVVPGLRDLNVDNMADGASQGSVLAIPGPMLDPLRAVEAFKPTQRWSMFRRPATVWRSETIRMASMLQSVDSREKKRSIRKIIVGARGCGKTVLLLQAMAMAFLRGWIVINLPDGKPVMKS